MIYSKLWCTIQPTPSDDTVYSNHSTYSQTNDTVCSNTPCIPGHDTVYSTTIRTHNGDTVCSAIYIPCDDTVSINTLYTPRNDTVCSNVLHILHL